MHYLDTSLLVALLLDEVDSAAARAWFTTSADDSITSPWARTEVASALSIKQRTGVLSAAQRGAAADALDRLLAEEIEVVPVLGRDFAAAERMAARVEPALRAGDALHLAVASRLRAVVHTLDVGQAAAATAHGIDAVVPVPRP